MPSFTTFILNDGTDDHTFTPVAISTAKSVLVSREGTTAAGNPTAILGMKLASGINDSNVATCRLNQPIEETESGVIVVRDTLRFKMEAVIPNRRTAAERLAFYNMSKAAAAHALWLAYQSTLDPLYG